MTDSPDHIHDAIVTLADSLGHPPQATQLFMHSEVSQYEFYKHYDRYTPAVEDAGLDPTEIPDDLTDTEVSEEELRSRILDVAVVTTGELKMNETLREAGISQSVVYKHYDTWGALMADLGLEDRLTPQAQRSTRA